MAGPAGSVTFTLAGDPPHGLLRSARVVANDSDTVNDLYDDRFGAGSESTGEDPPRQIRWPSGFTVMPEDCGGGTLIDPCGDTGGEDPTPGYDTPEWQR